jgi:hypothetical protein
MTAYADFQAFNREFHLAANQPNWLSQPVFWSAIYIYLIIEYLYILL